MTNPVEPDGTNGNCIICQNLSKKNLLEFDGVKELAENSNPAKKPRLRTDGFSGKHSTFSSCEVNIQADSKLFLKKIQNKMKLIGQSFSQAFDKKFLIFGSICVLYLAMICY